MELNLTRPIAFFDLETTGINIAKDRIVEISILKVFPDGKKELRTERINPTIRIPAKTTKIHGIKNEDVKDKPTFAELANEFKKFIEGCDLCGFNSNKFDVPLIAEEFLRAGVDFDVKKRNLIDVQVIFHKMEQRNLVAAYKFYCNKNLKDAHSAEADTIATYEVLKAQIERYENLTNDMNELSKISYHNKNADLAGMIIFNSKGVEVLNFGKHKGVPVELVFQREQGYYNWMMNGDFPLYTKKVITAIKLRSAFKGKISHK